jgi:hypothetical protein
VRILDDRRKGFIVGRRGSRQHPRSRQDKAQ